MLWLFSLLDETKAGCTVVSCVLAEVIQLEVLLVWPTASAVELVLLMTQTLLSWMSILKFFSPFS